MTKNWQPDPNDPAAFAAIQWHVNRLQNLAISLYVTDRRKYNQIAAALRDAARSLHSLRSFVEGCRTSSDCPDEYKCVDGQCEPDVAPEA